MVQMELADDAAGEQLRIIRVIAAEVAKRGDGFLLLYVDVITAKIATHGICEAQRALSQRERCSLMVRLVTQKDPQRSDSL